MSEVKLIPLHRFAASSTSNRCVVLGCNLPKDAKVHTDWLAGAVGAELIECPSCGDVIPVTKTVRVYKYDKKGVTREGDFRVCRGLCDQPKTKRNPRADAAIRLARGSITEDEYFEILEGS